MFRKTLIILLMGVPLLGAIVTGTSMPVLLFMGILLFIALAESSVQNEQQE